MVVHHVCKIVARSRMQTLINGIVDKRLSYAGVTEENELCTPPTSPTISRSSIMSFPKPLSSREVMTTFGFHPYKTNERNASKKAYTCC